MSRIHLSEKASICSSPPTLPVLVHGDHIIHYASPTIRVTDACSGKVVRRMDHTDVQCMCLANGRLYVFTNEIFIYSMESLEMVDLIGLSRPLISHAVVTIRGEDEYILLSKLNNRVYLLQNKKIISDVPSTSHVSHLFMNAHLHGFVDKDRILAYNQHGKVVDMAVEDVMFAFVHEKKVYTLNGDSVLREWTESREERLPGGITSCYFEDGLLHCARDGEIYSHSTTNGESYSTDMRELVECYGITTSTRKDDPAKKIRLEAPSASDGEDEDLRATEGYITKDIIRFDNNIVLHRGFHPKKVFGFNDDVTDSVVFNHFLIMSTASGYLECTPQDVYSEGEYLCPVSYLRVHGDAISSMSLHGDLLLTGSRDSTACIFRLSVSADGELSICRLSETVSSSAIVAAAMGHGIMALASQDYILQIFRVEEAGQDVLAIEQILVEKIHDGDINNMVLTDRYIITCSSDKSAKIFSHSGECLRTIASNKMLCAASCTDYLAMCSYKTIQIYGQNLELVSSLQTKRPVLSSCFYAGKLLAMSDVLRVYDIQKGKCSKSYDFGVENAWSFSFPIICGENKTVLLHDESDKVNEELRAEARALREEALLLEKYRRESRYSELVSMLARKGDYAKMFGIVCEAYYSTHSLECLGVLAGCRDKIIEMLLKCPGFKHSEVYQRLVERELSLTSDKKKKQKILGVLTKHREAVEKMYMDLIGMEVHEI